MDRLPIVDLERSDAAHRLTAAMVDVGFVAVTGHGVADELLDAMRRTTEAVFAVDNDVKEAYRITRDNYRGFVPLGFFTPNRAEVDGETPAGYELFKLHWECPPHHRVRKACGLYGTNRWVAEVPEMRDHVLAYWSAMEDLGARLLTIVAAELGLDAEMLRIAHSAPLTNMSLLRYPADRADRGEIGIHPHKDTNVLTIIEAAPEGGLEVRVGGGWLDVDQQPGALVVNIGEMLELWSGGRLRATPHRVVNRSGMDRHSFPWFMVPNHDVVVEPLLEPVDGFSWAPQHVGTLSAEVWRTNWPDEPPSDSVHDLGALDR